MLRALPHRQARQAVNLRNCFPYRCFSTTKKDTKDALRRVLREVAQPVAVVTSFYPLDGKDDRSEEPEMEAAHESQSQAHKKFHGATLSSFTSIALDPDPLVAFSLRIPSRMATSLKERLTLDRESTSSRKPNLVINLLSSTQAETAHHFARADLFPEPFRITPYALTEEGLPVLTGALGVLSCELISCTPLHNLCDPKPNMVEDRDGLQSEGVISELFISRVARVEKVESLVSGSGALPLVYHRRKYATVRPH